jgi:hypothetical protein
VGRGWAGAWPRGWRTAHSRRWSESQDRCTRGLGARSRLAGESRRRGEQRTGTGAAAARFTAGTGCSSGRRQRPSRHQCPSHTEEAPGSSPVSVERTMAPRKNAKGGGGNSSSSGSGSGSTSTASSGGGSSSSSGARRGQSPCRPGPWGWEPGRCGCSGCFSSSLRVAPPFRAWGGGRARRALRAAGLARRGPPGHAGEPLSGNASPAGRSRDGGY